VHQAGNLLAQVVYLLHKQAPHQHAPSLLQVLVLQHPHPSFPLEPLCQLEELQEEQRQLMGLQSVE
jgi:hypothetical protein